MVKERTADPIQTQGLFKKYEVKRIDGKTDSADTKYFVLKYGTAEPIDSMTRDALTAYQNRAELQGFEVLAADLRQVLRIEAVKQRLYEIGEFQLKLSAEKSELQKILLSSAGLV
jgi:hypothetical protein